MGRAAAEARTGESAAVTYARKILKSVSTKADENKRLTNLLFFAVLAATVFSPILILLPIPQLWSKIAPAVFTGFAALASGWVQLKRPQERWALYRTAQREIEFEIDQHEFGLGEYTDPQARDSVLAETVSKRALQLHYEWLPMVPQLQELQKTTENRTGGTAR